MKNIYSILIILLIISSIVGLVWFISKDNTDNLLSNMYRVIDQQGKSQETQSNINNSTAKIINLHSHPQQGENWMISFQTEGTADLRIIPQDQATIDDDEFIALYCGNKQITPQILENDVIYYKNWSCPEKAQIIHYTKKAGRHTLKFQFGQTIMYAYNSAAWYNPAWTKRKKITIQNAYVDSNLTNFPLYVDITSDTDIGASAQADGDDILFTTDDGITQIPHEEEYFNISAGSATGHYWVKVPTINSESTTDIYVYYGNSNASDQQQVTDVWDSNTIGVWHMGESAWDGTADEVVDSTSNNNNGTAAGNATTTTGKIGRGGTFDGDGDYVDLYDTAPDILENLSEFAISAWVKSSQSDISNESNVIQQDFIIIFRKQASTEKFIFSIWNDSETQSGYAVSSTYADINWHYLVAMYNNAQITLYVDGVLDSTPQAFTGLTNSNNARPFISNDTVNQAWDGQIDNVMIYNRALSADEIKFQYYNQNEADNELTWDSEESYTPVPYKLFKGNIRFNVNPDD